jgi:hypothetical protein
MEIKPIEASKECPFGIARKTNSQILRNVF